MNTPSKNPYLQRLEEKQNTPPTFYSVSLSPSEKKQEQLRKKVNDFINLAEKDIDALTDKSPLEKALLTRQLLALSEINNAEYTDPKNLISFFASTSSLLKDLQPKEKETTQQVVAVQIVLPDGQKHDVMSHISQYSPVKLLDNPL